MEMKIKAELGKDTKEPSSVACGCSGGSRSPRLILVSQPSAPLVRGPMPPWVVGKVVTPAGAISKVSTELSPSDHWEHVRCRISAFRNDYRVPPGLYAVGEPDRKSDVLVSANYKLSFDALRRELRRLNVWVLVLDTKGINVWCAAGKGTFGTEELIRRISLTRLDTIVDHRRLIVPQLGAPGVSGHKVSRATGFRVLFGPVQARDIAAYIDAEYKATSDMRTIRFSLFDRLILTPMEMIPAMKKYPLYAVLVLGILGLQPSGIIFKDALAGGTPFLLLGLIAVLAGAFLTPLLLPVIPSRSFAVKGWLVGMLAVVLSLQSFTLLSTSLLVFACVFFPLVSSYIALQFTGATTFTGMAGVKKELRFAIPVYLVFGVVSVMLLIAFKLDQWGVL